MKISIAMTTYNGERHIMQQIDSVRKQSLPPDEVIICDDASRDNTVQILKKYIDRYNLKEWHIIENRDSLGWKENFRKAISLTTGDIIFFSDQDDIWFLDKIKCMSEIMMKKNAGCLYGRGIIIDEKGKEIIKRNVSLRYSGETRRVPLTDSFYAVGGLGCCMCISRKVAEKYLTLNCTFDDHDSQCPRIAVLYENLWMYDKPVIKYRIHNNNTSNISQDKTFGSSSLEKRIENLEEIMLWLERASKDEEFISNEKIKSHIKNALKVENQRYRYLKINHTLFITLLKYIKSYPNLTMLLGDFSYKHHINDFMGKIRWSLRKRK